MVTDGVVVGAVARGDAVLPFDSFWSAVWWVLSWPFASVGNAASLVFVAILGAGLLQRPPLPTRRRGWW